MYNFDRFSVRNGAVLFSPSLKSDLMSMIGAAVDPEGDGASPMRPGESLRYQILGVPLLGIPQ